MKVDCDLLAKLQSEQNNFHFRVDVDDDADDEEISADEAVSKFPGAMLGLVVSN